MYKKKFKRHNYYIIFSITFKSILLHANYISKKRIEFYLSLNPLTFVHKTQKLFRNMYLFYLYVCVCMCACVLECLHTHHVHAGAFEGQNRYQIPRKWSYRCLWATIWVLGKESRPSAKASALNFWKNSPATQQIPFHRKIINRSHNIHLLI